MMTPIKKAAGGFKTTTATTSASHQAVVYPSRRTHFSLSYYIDSKQHKPHEPYTPFFYGGNEGLADAWQHLVEGMKFQICRVTHPRKPRKPSFQGLAGQRTDRLEYRSVKPRDTIQAGASNTTSEAVYLPVSKVFSCPKFMVLDVGRAYPQGWPQRFGVVTKPHVHLVVLVSRRMVSEFPEGIKTMTHVNTITTPKTGNTSPLTRQQAIENALSLALFHIRKGDTHQAVAKSIRAASMLKQACAEAQIGGAV